MMLMLEAGEAQEAYFILHLKHLVEHIQFRLVEEESILHLDLALIQFLLIATTLL